MDNAKPPEGTHPDAGAAAATASLPVPAGATKQMVALGERIFLGQVGGATCTGCHGADAKGTPLGPNLTDTQWLWGDGSYASIEKTITDGVPQPKKYRSPMPPMGGAQLTSDQVSALAAYIWALSHRSAATSSTAAPRMDAVPGTRPDGRPAPLGVFGVYADHSSHTLWACFSSARGSNHGPAQAAVRSAGLRPEDR